MEKEKKIGFEDLSTALKILVILGWIAVVIYAASFIVGIIYGSIYSVSGIGY